MNTTGERGTLTRNEQGERVIIIDKNQSSPYKAFFIGVLASVVSVVIAQIIGAYVKRMFDRYEDAKDREGRLLGTSPSNQTSSSSSSSSPELELVLPQDYITSDDNGVTFTATQRLVRLAQHLRTNVVFAFTTSPCPHADDMKIWLPQMQRKLEAAGAGFVAFQVDLDSTLAVPGLYDAVPFTPSYAIYVYEMKRIVLSKNITNPSQFEKTMRAIAFIDSNVNAPFVQ